VQVSPSFVKVNKHSLQTNITSLNHVPTKASWDLGVTKVLQMIKGRHNELVKVKHLLTFPTIQKERTWKA
jgi:menaquinone-specific isochorismate synthase